MLFPIGDTNVVGGAKPIFSYTLIAANIIIFFFQLSTPGYLVCEFATIPREILAGDHLHTLFSSMFLHGGWMHLIGNMLFLWVFADNIEAIVGNSRFIIFYLLGGLFASAAHIFIDVSSGGAALSNCCMPCPLPSSCNEAMQLCAGFIPSLGASGAISAVMGAYIVMFPTSKVRMLFFFFVIQVPAIFFLGFWFAEQLFAGVGSLGPVSAQTTGVAWWAHIGGFVFGLVFGLLNRYRMKEVLYHR